jgi:hypothetical protein
VLLQHGVLIPNVNMFITVSTQKVYRAKSKLYGSRTQSAAEEGIQLADLQMNHQNPNPNPNPMPVPHDVLSPTRPATAAASQHIKYPEILRLLDWLGDLSRRQVDSLRRTHACGLVKRMLGQAQKSIGQQIEWELREERRREKEREDAMLYVSLLG